MSNLKITELIGVYDADATLIGELSYWVGARFGIRHCSLCDITHSLFRKKSEWTQAANKLQNDLGVTFLAFHRDDQPADVKKMIAGAYPAVVARLTNNQLQLFMSDKEITACDKSPEAFIAAITKKLAQ